MQIRSTAVARKISYATNLPAAEASVKAIRVMPEWRLILDCLPEAISETGLKIRAAVDRPEFNQLAHGSWVLHIKPS